jgi:hypothetical protein
MQTKNGIVVASILPVICAIGINLALAEDTDVRTKVPHISAYKALELFKVGRLILLDVHPKPNKTNSKIVGALYVSAGKIDKVRLKIPKNKLIGVFCD